MKLLLATDTSFNGVEAARYVTGLTADGNLDVTLLTVSFDPQGPMSTSTQPWLPEYREHETERVELHHAELKSMLTAAGATVTTLRTSGDTRRDVLREANRLDVDLIVMGARGHSAVGRILLGSTSDYIATHADCSVLVVRSKDRSDQVQLPKKVMIAYDGSASSREAIDELMEVQLPRETSASVVSVVPTMDFYTEPYAAMIEQGEAKEIEEKQVLVQRIASQISTQLPSTVTQVVKGSHTGETLVLAAEQSDADLVVVGETGHSILAEWILGSTSKYVLRHAPCSVWISRHHRSSDTSEPQDPDKAAANLDANSG